MPQLSTIIDKLLRRAGLDAGEKATICADIGAAPANSIPSGLWHAGNTYHESTWAPVFYAASWGSSTTAKQGDPFRPWGNYQSMTPPAGASQITVHLLDAGIYAYLNLNGTTAGYIDVTVTGPGRLVIFASDRKNLNLRIKASHASDLDAYLGTVQGPTLSTGSLEIYGGKIGYLNVGTNVQLFNCLVHGSTFEIRHINEFTGSYGGYGSGGSYSYVNYNLLIYGSTVKGSTIFGNALTGYTSTFDSCYFDLAASTFNNCFNG